MNDEYYRCIAALVNAGNDSDAWRAYCRAHVTLTSDEWGAFRRETEVSDIIDRILMTRRV